MSLRSTSFLAALLIAGCGTPAPSPAQSSNSSGVPFASAEVARFDSPWAMDFLPGSGVPLTKMALVTERTGALWLVDVATGKKQRVSGVPQVHVAGQGGLGDVVVRMESLGKYRVYLSYVEAGADGTSGAVVGYGGLLFTGPAVPDGPVGVSLRDFKVIWRQSPKVTGDGHFSHRIAFAPDGTMFVSSGDRQKMEPAQDASSDLGKVIHMDAEGRRIGGRYLSTGHRNVLGLAFAPDGRLWASEMGPRGGDELNLIVKGRNYGWPRASNGSHYSRVPIPDHKPGDGFEAPKVSWTPSVSPGSLLIYTGDLFPQWKGDALIGALSGEALIRVDISGDQARKAEQWPMGSRIRAVEQGPQGEVYLLEDGPGARLLKLTPAA